MRTTTSRIGCVVLALLSISTVTTRSVVAQGRQPVVLSVERFMLGGLHHTRGNDSLSTALRLPSPNKALTLSLAWTLVPIAAGAAIWAAQKPEHFVEYYGGQVTWEYDKGPNRTLPLVLIATGVMIGPSAGYFYGDCDARGGTGIAIRGITAGVITLTVAVIANSDQSYGFMDFSGLDAAITAGAIGCGIIVIDSIYDLCLVKKNIQSQNNRRLATRVGLVPGFSPSGGTPTLSLQVTF